MSVELTNLVCPNPKCGEEIAKPILLTDLSQTPAESYYACPRCLTKLDLDHEAEEGPETIPKPTRIQDLVEKEETREVEPQKPEERQIERPELKDVKPEKEKHAEPEEPKREAPSGCPHYLGYLGKRPKNAPIPEECLTCKDMVKCMFDL